MNIHRVDIHGTNIKVCILALPIPEDAGVCVEGGTGKGRGRFLLYASAHVLSLSQRLSNSGKGNGP